MSVERTNRNTWFALGLLVLLVLLGLASFGGGMMGRGFFEGNRLVLGAPWLWGIGLFGMFARLLVWGALIVLAVGFFRRRAARSDAEGSGSDLTPFEILKRRYAAGEINREQFEEMRGVLESRS
jgi:putative membrane protein